MIALMIDSVGKTGVADIPMPDIAPTEALIVVDYGGICGSDVHVFRDQHEFRKPPVIIGHELTGIIEKCGADVKRLKIGDRVTVLPQVTCMKCEQCLRGRPMLCRERLVPGTDKWIGAFVEHFNAPESVIFTLPDNVDNKTGVLAEPLAVACRAISRIPEENRKRLLIMGVGNIGMLALIAARRRGFDKIAVADVMEYNLRKALNVGADAAINVSMDDSAAAVAEIFGDEGPDAVVLTAGGPAMQYAIDTAGRGAVIVYVAMITAPLPLSTRPIVGKELSLIGCRTYNHSDFREAVDMLAANMPIFEPLVTHVFPADRVQDGFELMESHKEGFLKIAIKMQSG
jgi:L-iditol 2-dehydrogenase